MYLEEEYAPIFHTWKADPSPANTADFLKALDPVLQSALKSYAGGSKSPLLHGRAKLLALDAARRYDPGRARLRTHLLTHLQPLRVLAARENQPVALPEKVGLHLHRLHHAENELRDRLGREPSTGELADHTGLSLKRIAGLRRSRPAYAEGQLVQPGEDGGLEPFNPAIRDDNEQAWREFVFQDLSPTDQVVMERSLGLHGHKKHSKKAIATHLRITPGAVTQRAAKIQALLDQREELGSIL